MLSPKDPGGCSSERKIGVANPGPLLYVGAISTVWTAQTSLNLLYGYFRCRAISSVEKDADVFEAN